MPDSLKEPNLIFDLPIDVLSKILSRYLSPESVFYISKSCTHAHRLFKPKSAKNRISKSLIQKRTRDAVILEPGRYSTWFATRSYNKPLLFVSGEYLKKKNRNHGKTIENSLVPIHLPGNLSYVDSIQTSGVTEDYSILIGRNKQGKPMIAGWGENIKTLFGIKDNVCGEKMVSIDLPSGMVAIDIIKISYCQIIISGKDKLGNAFVSVAGWNPDGQLGAGDDRLISNFTSVKLPERMKFVDLIELSPNHTVFKGRDKSNNVIIATTGMNNSGQLGTGDNNNKKELTVVNIPNHIVSVVSIAVENGQTAIVGKDKENHPIVAVTGMNSNGTLGTGDYEDKNIFTVIRLPDGMKSVDSVALENGHAIVSGKNGKGSPMVAVSGEKCLSWLETENENKNQFVPMTLPEGLQTIECIEFGLSHALILGRDKIGNPIVASAGKNKYGQLGLGHTKNQKKEFTLITLPEGMVEVNSIRADINQSFIVGRDEKNAVMVAAFGDNENHKLGLSKGKIINVPTVIPRAKTPYKKEKTLSEHTTISL